MASSDPGSKVNGWAAVATGETEVMLNSGCCAPRVPPFRVPERESDLPDAPPEPEEGPTESMLRSW